MKWIPLLLTNFLGILNDNFLKKLFAFISIYWIAGDDKNLLIGIAGFLFIIPYILFSPYAGLLAKRIHKKKILVVAKFTELPIVILGGLGFYLQTLELVYASIFFMGLQSCLFSPAKYGLIRDVGGEQGISFGTGAFEMVAFLGNLFGVVLAGIIADFTSQQELFILMILIAIALLGIGAAKLIKAQESQPEPNLKTKLNPVAFAISSIKWGRSIKGLNSIIFSLGMFWFAAAMIEMVIANHCPNVLNMSMTKTGWLMAIVAVSIALGSLFAGIISNKKVELGWVPVGTIGFAVPMIMIVFLQPEETLFSILLITAAFFAGIFKIPLNAFIQERVKGRKIGDILAFNNLSVFFFILLSAVVMMVLEDTYQVFTVIAIVNTFMVFYSLFFVKEMRTRLFSVFK